MNDIRRILNLFEDEKIKNQVIGMVKTTDDDDLLSKILVTLQAGNIDKRIESVLMNNADGKQFMKQIADVIIGVDAPIELKDRFLSKLNDGIISSTMLLDRKQHSFMDLCGNDPFATEVFIKLCTELTSQGVGPCEVALAVYSPDIKWSGRAVGGGDIQVGKLAVEVKGSVVAGGRWINPRKAKMDMAGVEKAIVDAEMKVRKEFFKVPNADQLHIGLPARLSPEYWCDKVRPQIAPMPQVLAACAKKMADGVFGQTNNKAYVDAIISGDPTAIKTAMLKVGYDNYKAYSHFDGILLMDVPTASSEYFPDYESMQGKINARAPYMYGPEGEVMPQVKLISTGSGNQFDDSGYLPASDETTPSRKPSKVKNPDEVSASTHGVTGLKPQAAKATASDLTPANKPRSRR